MPGRNYLSHYQHMRLNEVIIPGAHDAGVYTDNATNVQTQDKNIAEQANCGCRFFDCRIATHKMKQSNGSFKFVHQAYHLDGSLVVDHKVSSKSKAKYATSVTSHQTRRLGQGGWGGNLTDILIQARQFVRDNPSEFLILKFSKCFNWPDIAEHCRQLLQGNRYTGGGNLNNKTVAQLAGNVITIFDESSRRVLGSYVRSIEMFGEPHGIMFCKALYDKKSGTSKGYLPNYAGLQYFGKFSSTPEIDKNTNKQRATLETGSATHMDALGMMYWTTTGMFENIRTRNSRMWTRTNIRALQETWEAGLEAAISSRFGREKEQAMLLATSTGGLLGGRLKAFMPNIVMMDFVNRWRCDIVDDLNHVAAQKLQDLMVPAPQGVQPTPEPTGV